MIAAAQVYRSYYGYLDKRRDLEGVTQVSGLTRRLMSRWGLPRFAAEQIVVAWMRRGKPRGKQAA